jgi:hypothetical protein
MGKQAASVQNPAWRYIVASAVVVRPRSAKGKELDKYTEELVEFLKLVSKDTDEARDMYPDIADAFDIYNSNQRLYGHRWVVEAYLMTDASDRYIAEKYDFPTKRKAIAAYRKLFFDIDSYRHLKECIFGNVLCLAALNHHDMDDCDFDWKAYAYSFGKKDFCRLVDFLMGGKALSATQRAHFNQLLADRVLYSSSNAVLHMKSAHLEKINLLSNLSVRLNSSSGGGGGIKATDEDVETGIFNIIEAFNQNATSDTLESRIASNTSKVEPRLSIDYKAIQAQGESK